MGVARDLNALVSGRVRTDVPLREHTTWRVGGPARVFVEPAGPEDLSAVVKYARERGIPLTVLGNGSNLLIADEGLDGIVVKVGPLMSRIQIGQGVIEAQAGAKMARILSAAGEAGRGGLEFMAGIPASVGGAVAMNAGANGSSIGDRVLEVTVVDQDGGIQVRTRAELGFAYRFSVLQTSGAIVAAVRLACLPRSGELIRAEMREYLEKRRKTQPLEYPSAGSVFRNPPGEAAGRLIDRAGGKGLRVGDAQVSPKHANFIVNLGSAKAREILELMNRVQTLVLNATGILLEPEVKFLGKHGKVESVQ